MSKGRGPRKERRLGPESTGDSQVLGLGLQRGTGIGFPSGNSFLSWRLRQD